MRIIKKNKRPKILIILMYSNSYYNNICITNFKKSIKRARLIFIKWYDEEEIAKLLNNLEDKLDAIIVSGSDYRILDKKSPKVPAIIFKSANKIHILAICYGMQYVAMRFGRRSYINSKNKGNIIIYNRCLKINYPFDVKKTKYRYEHNDYIVGVDKNIEVVMKRTKKIDILYYKKRDILGIQFHPEYHLKSGKLFYNSWLSWISHRNM